MAIGSEGWKVSVKLMDAGGDITTRTYKMIKTVADDVETDALAILAALNPVTDCQIIGYEVSHIYAEDTVVFPSAGVQNENQAIVTVSLVGDPLKSATFSIPGANIGVFTAATGHGSNVVDVLDAALVTYATLFRPDGTGVAYISDLENLDFMRAGRRRHVKNVKG